VILRNAIGNFYKEAFKWLGEGMAAFAGKLKKPLSEELEKFMKGYVRVPIAPLRQSESEPQEQPKLTEIDVYDLADPIDVISKFD
jgi:hypothetical protein